MKLFKFIKFRKSESTTVKPRSIFSRVGRDPYIDWILIVSISFVTVLTLVSLSLFRYLSFDDRLKREVSSAKMKTATDIDTKSLDIVLKKLDNRANVREELLRSYSGPGDPSI